MSLPTSIGRYQVIDRLGTGGMATLYLALDPTLGRKVAIKVVDHDLEPDWSERFLREARAVAALQHRNIVMIHDVGTHDGRPFIAMEYVDGRTLQELIRHAPLPFVRRLAIVRDLCGALHYAHQRGIVHRDVKPANVMIGADGEVKLLDFGIARTPDSGSTRAGMMIGTPHYMSPEQVEGRDVDARSDL
jgi:serine/threonine protein kinase